MIFPINDRVAELGEMLEREDRRDEDGVDGELGELLGRWQLRNWTRAGPALTAAVLLMLAGSP